MTDDVVRNLSNRPDSGFRWCIPETFNFAADVVDQWAANGDPEALIWANSQGQERRFRFSDISRLSRNLAAAMHDAGLEKGDRILIVLPRLPEWQISMVASLRLGLVPIPCIEMLTAREITYRAEHAGAKAVICRAGHADRIASGLEQVPLRFSVGPRSGWSCVDSLMARNAEPPETIVEAEDPAVMYYTSGSTGEPKGVLHAARGLFAWRYSAEYWLDVHPGDRIWCTADTGWSKAGTSILFGPWSQGACAFFYDGPFNAAERLRLLAGHRISVYCAPATELSRLLQEDVSSYDLSNLRRTVSAGEAVSAAICQKWRALTGLDVAEAYGQTETLMSALTLKGMETRPGSMGVAGPGMDLAVIDDEGSAVDDGELGQIALAMPCPQMMLGYWKDPERTAACFIDGPDSKWFLTGDLGHRDADGYFWYHSRADDIINSSGYRIGPTEVENVLLEHPAILECAVVGVPDEERGQIVKAFVVLRPGNRPSDALTAELQNHAKTQAAPYKYPRAVEYREELPKGPTGKLLRRALRNAQAKG